MNSRTIPHTKLSVILHDIRSVYNVGSAFRTADAAGAGMIWLTGFTPGPDTHPDRITKTALGAQGSVPWRRAKRVGDAVRALRKRGARVVALEVRDDAVDYRRFRPTWPLAVLVGNEVKGIPKRLLRSRHRSIPGLRNVDDTSHNLVDEVVCVPMRGGKESLNVSVALGVALFEFTRRWK
jgi:tRNA G18 (ribose-2'-O)-methylase SpoU